MYFGDGHAPFPSSLCMTWPFFILCELFCMWPAKVTTWCVRTQSKTGVPYSGPDPPPVHPTPGTFDHMDAHPDTSGSSSFRAFREVWDTAAEPLDFRANSPIFHHRMLRGTCTEISNWKFGNGLPSTDSSKVLQRCRTSRMLALGGAGQKRERGIKTAT